MPCYSRITNTKMNDATNLGAALSALGYVVEHGTIKGRRIVGTKGSDVITFERNDSTSTFNVSGDTDNLAAIGKKYAEVGVRAWATRRGFSVTENDGTNMTLTNRRAF